MSSELLQAALALIGAVIVALSGYLKNRKTEEFQGYKVLVTLVFGIIVSILSVTLKLPIDSAEGLAVLWMGQMGLTSLLETWAKAVWRNWIEPKLSEGKERAEGS